MTRERERTEVTGGASGEAGSGGEARERGVRLN